MYFLRSFARDCECEKKMDQNCLDTSAFAMVFQQARNADAAAGHMLSSYEPGNRNSSLLSRESIFVLRWPEPITPSLPLPDFQKKSQVKIG